MRREGLISTLFVIPMIVFSFVGLQAASESGKVWASSPRAYISHPNSDGMVNNFPNVPAGTVKQVTSSADTLTLNYVTGPQDGNLKKGYEAVWFEGTSGWCVFQYVLRDSLLPTVIDSAVQIWYKGANQTPAKVSAERAQLGITETYVDTTSVGTGTDYYRFLDVETRIIQGTGQDTTTTNEDSDRMRFHIKVGY